MNTLGMGLAGLLTWPVKGELDFTIWKLRNYAHTPGNTLYKHIKPVRKLQIRSWRLRAQCAEEQLAASRQSCIYQMSQHAGGCLTSLKTNYCSFVNTLYSANNICHFIPISCCIYVYIFNFTVGILLKILRRYLLCVTRPLLLLLIYFMATVWVET